MHCGVMVTGNNHGDWARLMAGEYDRPPEIPDYVHFDETLEVGGMVEPLGFDSIWATEHYGSAYSMQPNPLQYLAYWAGRTKRIELGTSVIVAPWWNPVRLAHEVSMLDVLLQGRKLHLGIGRGVASHEYASLGVPLEESHKYFYDVVNILRASDGAQRFTFDGEIFQVPPTSVRPQGRHFGSLTKDIRAAFTTRKSAQLAAENGLGQMFITNDDVETMSAGVRQFNEIRAELGLPPDNPTTMLWMYCAPTSAEAEEGWEYFRGHTQEGRFHQFEWGSQSYEGISGYEEYHKLYSAKIDPGVDAAEKAIARHRNTQPIGTPDEIIDRLKAVQSSIDAGMLVLQVFFGGMPKEKAEKSIKLFAEKVLPEVHAMQVG